MFVPIDSTSPSSVNRLKAYHETASRLGVQATTVGPYEPNSEYMTVGAHAAQDVLGRKPGAVIGYNDMLTVGLMAELGRHGIRPGIDIGIAGFGGSWLCETTTPALTSVELPFTHAMQCAVQDVIDLIENREAISLRELPSRLVVRASTPGTGIKAVTAATAGQHND